MSSWRGAAGSGHASTAETEEAAPQGCARCFGNPDVLAGMAAAVHRRTDRLVDDSHLGVSLAECLHCGQPSVQIFEEEVDWQGGDDAQRYEIIAITERDRARLRAAGEWAARSLAETIGRDRVRLWWSWPTGGQKTSGRAEAR